MNISSLTLRNLEYIVAVAEEGHFGRAAEACGVSQPALSTQIQKVEQWLGFQLFERIKRSFRPTPIGIEVIEQARQVLMEARKLVKIAEHRSRPLSGVFRLGAIATLGPYLMPYLLKPLRKRYPDLELILHEGLTDALLVQLRSGDLDAVLLSPPVTEKEIRIENLFVEPFYLIVPVEHRLASVTKLNMNMLSADEMLLLEDGHCLREQALEVCPSREKWRQDRYQATSLETLRHMVASGAGYSLLPALAVSRAGQLGGLIKYRQFSGKVPSRTIGLAWRRSGVGTDAEEFAAFVRNNIPREVTALKGK